MDVAKTEKNTAPRVLIIEKQRQGLRVLGPHGKEAYRPPPKSFQRLTSVEEVFRNTVDEA